MFKTKTLRHGSAIAAVVLLAAVSQLCAQDSWTWRMPVSIYQNLDFEKRAAIDRGRDSYIRAEQATQRNAPVPDQIPLYRAASAEWQKFRVQFELETDIPDSVNAYVVFMQAMSLQGARDRNSAIKMYRELLDFFVDETWITPAALYMIGQNQLDNGENTKAKNTFEELVDNPAMLSHPLASRAYKNLGNYYWSMKKYTQAQECWRAGASEKYKTIARSDYLSQRELLRSALSITCKWNELTDFIFEGIEEKNVKGRADAVVAAEDFFKQWNIRNIWNAWYYSTLYLDNEKAVNEAWAKWNEGFSKWHESHKSLFVQADREWLFSIRALYYRREYSAKEANKLIPKISDLLKASPEATLVARTREFGFALCDFKMFDEAHTLTSVIKTPVDQLWYTFEVDRRAGKWDACELSLQAIVANSDPAVSLQGKKSLAWLYKDAMREYEKAIKLYLDISQPPETLWSIYECYRRSGKKPQAYATLQEIAFFPNYAARSVFRQAEDHRDDGEKEQAIALYRRLLSQPEWKKTWESSQAHQRLEAMGFATGGAVVDEVR